MSYSEYYVLDVNYKLDCVEDLATSSLPLEVYSLLYNKYIVKDAENKKDFYSSYTRDKELIAKLTNKIDESKDLQDMLLWYFFNGVFLEFQKELKRVLLATLESILKDIEAQKDLNDLIECIKKTSIYTATLIALEPVSSNDIVSRHFSKDRRLRNSEFTANILDLNKDIRGVIYARVLDSHAYFDEIDIF